MTEDGRLIRTDPVAMGVWKRLTTQFAVWRMIVFAGFSRRALLQFSNDQMTPLARAVHWKVGLGLLGGLSDEQVDFLLAFARINARKVERVFRTSTLILVSVPVAGVFGLTEIDPGIWVRLGFAQMDTLILVLAIWMLASGVMLAASWRANELVELIEFEQARRQYDAARRDKASAE
ncbi:hypothetical protein [Maricaulis parjimensis]|uniref:hypothetical protein n=1 Tax=Maricaulis parjimensis TaxID=144023 RepID=UPI00193A3E41|nr:hypothetical protein [Maricaulis parjimensis]